MSHKHSRVRGNEPVDCIHIIRSDENGLAKIYSMEKQISLTYATISKTLGVRDNE
jgi:hypothetical protein